MTVPSFNDNRRAYKRRHLFIVDEPATTASFLQVKWVRAETGRREMAKRFPPNPVMLQGDWKSLDVTYAFFCAIAPDTGPHIENPHLKVGLYDPQENRIWYHPECDDDLEARRLDPETLRLFQPHNMLVFRFMEDFKTFRKSLVFPLHIMDDLLAT